MAHETISRLDHVAFVVHSLDDALRGLVPLDLTPGAVRSFPDEGTRECYVGPSDSTARILLMEPTGDGPYASALARRGPGLHHVALRITDLDAFLAVVVDSGWLVHPKSFATRANADTIWLARPGVEALVECHESDAPLTDESVIDAVAIAGLDIGDRLASIFEAVGVRVSAGRRSGVVVGDRFIASLEHADIARELGDAYEYNRQAWDRNVRIGNRWTIAVDEREVSRARDGSVEVLLTPTKPVPSEWLGELSGADILCLASGGGQQGPLFAAAGANVTVFDASDEQLERDREVARREDLEIVTIQGDMRDLSALADESFDLVFHPVSNDFVAEIEPVWHEAHRVLRPGGHLLVGFSKAVVHCFDWGSIERGDPRLRYRLPYSDLDHLDDPAIARMLEAGEPLEFGHPLQNQIGGQIEAGFAIIGFYEDCWGDEETFPDMYFDQFVATRAYKR